MWSFLRFCVSFSPPTRRAGRLQSTPEDKPQMHRAGAGKPACARRVHRSSADSTRGSSVRLIHVVRLAPFVRHHGAQMARAAYIPGIVWPTSNNDRRWQPNFGMGRIRVGANLEDCGYKQKLWSTIRRVYTKEGGT